MSSVYHIPVLVDESIDLLLYNKEKTLTLGLPLGGSKIYVDCTLGGGGYTERILNLTDDYTKVISIDRDVNALNFCKKSMKKYSNRIMYCLDNFSNIKNILNNYFSA
ncbi:MAG: 16S rRNA (cytosine(1402)-N(4))-methyltransferase, partial [Ignavibacteria bacterium]